MKMNSVAWCEGEIENMGVCVTLHILEFFCVEELEPLYHPCGSRSVSLSVLPKREAKIRVISI